MKDDISIENELKNEYLQLKKCSSYLREQYPKIMSKNFDVNEWKKERKILDNNMRKYSSLIESLEKSVDSYKGYKDIDEKVLLTIKDGLVKIKKEFDYSKYKEIKAKIDKFKIITKDDKDLNEDEDNFEQIYSINTFAEELKKIRKKAMEDLEKTAKLIKETKEKIEIDKEEKIEVKEEPLLKEEKKEEKEVEGNEEKKIFLGIEWTRHKIIVTVLIAIIVILTIIAIVIGCKK